MKVAVTPRPISSRSSRTNSRPHYHHRNSGFPPQPPLVPTPPPPHHPYHLDGPPAADSWRRAQRTMDVRPRYPRSEPHWSTSSRWEEGRRRSSNPPPRRPPPLPRYVPRWSSQTNSRDAAVDMWERPQMRHGQGHLDKRKHSRDNF